MPRRLPACSPTGAACRARRVLTYLALGAGIGFVSGLSPGPVFTLVGAETLRGGWARGIAVALGPLLADGPIVLLAVVVLAQPLFEIFAAGPIAQSEARRNIPETRLCDPQQ